MQERDRSDAPTAVERPGGSAPDTEREKPSESPSDATSTSAFDPPRDRFETRGELGRGGMGRVDEAYDRALGRPVAIKHMLLPTGTELARFEREARITARLEHPGIVPIHDAGRTEDGTPYYVMRRVDGQPLSEVAAGKSLDERIALVPNLLAACDATAFAHARGVVHRDIKPTNILIGPFGETLLIDWGLAREVSSTPDDAAVALSSEPDLTRVGTVAGTPGFMSPEQARGEAVDARADVFALGVTLFYLLTGKLPWASSSATEMIDHVGAGREANWSVLPSEVPPDLRAVLEKAMASELTERYADAGALAADLRRFITGNLVGAREYGRLERVWRFVRRHRAAVGVGLVSLLVVAVIAAISVRRVIAERDDANAARALAELREGEKTDMVDRLIIDNATQLAATDPIAAIAKLRQLSPSSKRWREAWGPATTAWFNGVPFGFYTAPGPAYVRIAADNRHALVANAASGELHLIDLITRTRRKIAKLDRLFDCSWLTSAVTIACTQIGRIALVDVATGTVRQLTVDAASVHGDSVSRLLVHGNDRRLYELRAEKPELVEVASGVVDLTVSHDLAWWVIRTETTLTLHFRDQSWRIPWDVEGDGLPGIDVRDGLVTMLAWKEVKSFQVRDGKLVQLGVIPRTHLVLQVGSANGQSFSIDVNGVQMVAAAATSAVKRLGIRNTFATARGFIVMTDTGALVIRDSLGWHEIGRRPLTYRSVDHSPDGRFVAAVAETGDVLAWDLAGPRGRTIAIGRGELPGLLTKTELWTFAHTEGVHRHSLPDGADDLVIEHSHPLATADFDSWARWIAVGAHEQVTRIYDIATKDVVTTEGAVTNIAADEIGLGFGARDGSIHRWTPGTRQAARKIGAFPIAPKTIALRARYVLGVTDHDLMRLDIQTQTVERVEFPGSVIERIAIEDGGRAWTLAGGIVTRWDLGSATPQRVATAEPIVDIVALPRGVLLHTSKSITLDGDTQRLISASSGWVRVMSDNMLVTRTVTSAVFLIDLETAQRVELPKQAMSPGVVGTGTRIGMTTSINSNNWTFTYWDIDVPRSPVALQHWLQTITNARPIAGSDAVAWPVE